MDFCLHSFFYALSVYDERYIKTKLRAYENTVYTISEHFTIISIYILLVDENKHYQQVHLDNWV